MTLPVLLPQLPFGTGPVTLLAWLCQPGDAVRAGQPLVIVANERVEVALPAPAAGTLGQFAAAAGAQLAVGDVLAHIMPGRPTTPPQRATPLARRIAAALGVDLAAIAGSAPGGRILGRDVRQAAAPAPAPPRSARPQLPAQLPAHASSAFAAPPVGWSVMEARLGRQRGRPPAIPLLARAVAATIAALLHQPRAHARWYADGLAIARHLWLDVQFADQSRVLVARAEELNQRGVLRALADRSGPHEARSPLFTITETYAEMRLGQPVTVPQLVVGQAAAQPVVVASAAGEHVAVEHVCKLAFAYDARVLTYSEADSFLSAIVQHLERA